MKNLRVSQKLIISFSIVIVLAVLVGAVGIVGMYQINAADDAMYEGNYLPTVLADEISQNIVEQRIYLRNFVIYDVIEDADLFQNTVDDLEASKKEMEDLFAEYDLTIVNDADQKAFNEFLEVYSKEWIPLFNQIHSLGAANQTQEAKETLILGAAAAKKMDELSDTLQEINLTDGKKAVDGNTDLFKKMSVLECAVLLIAIAVALFFAIYISRLISKPLGMMAKALEQMGTEGDLALSPEMAKSAAECSTWKDEIGMCARAVGGLIGHLMDVERDLVCVAGGDLTVTVNTLSDRDNIGMSVSKLVDNLSEMFSEINASTTQVSTGSKQIADGAQSLAQGSAEQASTVEELSSSIAEISQKTKDNAGMADKAATLASTIMSNAERGSRQMGEMMTAVKEINEASQSINKVIKVIDDIAFQTNILALNAAVEAARAGQHGKGFAVVAEEVRNLAAKSAEAAKDTEGLIANSMEKAELGARIADETAASLNEIVSGINESTQLIKDIAKSSDEQSAGISQINTGIDQVAQVVQQNSATAEESAAASEEMSGQADMLERLVAQFRLKKGGAYHFQSLPSAGKNTYEPLAIPDSCGMEIDSGKY